ARAVGVLNGGALSTYRLHVEELEPRAVPTVGALDTSWHGDGHVRSYFMASNSTDRAQAAVVQTDGRLLVVGSTYFDGREQADFAFARYNPDGSPDTTFGVGGQATDNYNYVLNDESATCVALWPSSAGGGYAVGGYAHTGVAGQSHHFPKKNLNPVRRL